MNITVTIMVHLWEMHNLCLHVPHYPNKVELRHHCRVTWEDLIRRSVQEF